MSTLEYASATAIILAGMTWSFLKSAPREPYGLWHLELNKLPGDDTPPKTEWLNMGYWKDTTVFPIACKALALKLAAAGRVKPGASVLDVGHGTGESLLLLLSDPSLPKLSKLTGIVSLAAHHSRSRERVAATGKAILPQRRTNGNDNPGINVEDKIDATRVNLYHGDAVFRRESSSTSNGESSSGLHPLDPANTERFDTILALDCAYHFDTRRAFLEQSFQKLNPEGRIALTDLCLSPPPSHLNRQIPETGRQPSIGGWWNWKLMICRWVQCPPRRNELTAGEYVKQLEDIGYVDIEMEDITEHVLPSFCAFMKSTGYAGWVFGTVLGWFKDVGGRFVVISAAKPSRKQ